MNSPWLNSESVFLLMHLWSFLFISRRVMRTIPILEQHKPITRVSTGGGLNIQRRKERWQKQEVELCKLGKSEMWLNLLWHNSPSFLFAWLGSNAAGYLDIYVQNGEGWDLIETFKGLSKRLTGRPVYVLQDPNSDGCVTMNFSDRYWNLNTTQYSRSRQTLSSKPAQCQVRSSDSTLQREEERG